VEGETLWIVQGRFRKIDPESVVVLGRALCSQRARSIPLRRRVWSLGRAERLCRWSQITWWKTMLGSHSWKRRTETSDRPRHVVERREARAGVRGDIHPADSRGQENVGPWINRENLGWDTDVRPGGDSGPSGRSQLFPAWLLARREQLKKHLMRLVVRRRSWSEGWKGSKRLKKPRPHTWTHSALSEGRRNSEELSLGARRVLVQTVTRVRGRDTGLQNLCNDVDFWKKSY